MKTITAPDRTTELLPAGKILTITGNAIVEWIGDGGQKSAGVSVNGTRVFGPFGCDVPFVISAVALDVGVEINIDNRVAKDYGDMQYFESMAQFNAPTIEGGGGGPTVYGTRYAGIAGQLYWCDGVRLRTLCVKKASLVKNIWASSETCPSTNSNTGAAVNGLAGPSIAGISKWFRTSAGTGTCQTNKTVAADTNYYVVSFYGYMPIGTTGGQTKVAIALNGGASASLTYDWDNPSTASVGLTNNLPATEQSSWVVEDCGNGIRRFSYALLNAGQTLLYIQFGSSVAQDKIYHSGIQVEILSEGVSLRPGKYASTEKVAPFWGQGKSGQIISRDGVLPFETIVCFSDSIAGSGTNFKQFNGLLNYIGRGFVSAVGGTQIIVNNGSGTSILNRFYAATIPESSLLVIMGGTNDKNGDIPALVAALKAASKNYPYFLICGAYPKTDGTEDVGSVNYTWCRNFATALKTAFGDAFFDPWDVSIAAYDNASATDISDVALGRRPTSLRSGNDGLHPMDAENQVLVNAMIERINYLYLQ